MPFISLGCIVALQGADAITCSYRCAAGRDDSFSRRIIGDNANFALNRFAGGRVDASKIERHSLQEFQGAVDWAGGDGRSGERHRD
jgi:hypothetical protein